LPTYDAVTPSEALPNYLTYSDNFKCKMPVQSRAIDSGEPVLDDAWPEFEAEGQKLTQGRNSKGLAEFIQEETMQQADKLHDITEFQQVHEQMSRMERSSRLLTELHGLDWGVTDVSRTEKVIAYPAEDEKFELTRLLQEQEEIQRKERVAREQEEQEEARRKAKELQQARKAKMERLQKEDEERAKAEALRRLEEARVKLKLEQEQAAKRHAQACFRNSLKSLAETVDKGGNEALYNAQGQLNEIVRDAEENGLGDDELQEAREWEHKIAQACVKNIVEECTKVDMNSIGALRELKEQLTVEIRGALDHSIGELELAEAETWRRKVHNRIEDIKGSIRVFCRVRPLSEKEALEGDTAIARQIDSMTLELERGTVRPRRSSSRPKSRGSVDTSFDEDKPEMEVTDFRFDSVFAPASQEDVFEDCRDLMQSAFDGFNVTIFAYGQTGAGKTFTMSGTPENPGLAPQMIDEIFRIVEKDMRRFSHTVSTSMVELYRNELVDLLQKSEFTRASKRASMRTDKDGTVYFQNVMEE
jgi:hypothetical protein